MDKIWKEKPNRTNTIWSIGIYAGMTLSDLEPARGADNPVLSAKDVTDSPAQSVADPFMIKEHGTWYLFFEVMDACTWKGSIGLATSRDGLKWKYEQIVLAESFHMSYPYVFRLKGEYYLIPETHQAKAVRLYRADPFPTRWIFVKNILEGPWVDSSIFFFDARWWLFSSPVAPANEVLELFYADNITGPWFKHGNSPLMKGNKHMARSAGRVITDGGNPIRFTQNCWPFYGTSVRAFEVFDLTTARYAERELGPKPILSSGSQPWNLGGMHHIDSHFVDGSWFACTDGWQYRGDSEALNSGGFIGQKGPPTP